MVETTYPKETWVKIEEPQKKDNSNGTQSVTFWNPAKKTDQSRSIEGIVTDKAAGKYGLEVTIKSKEGQMYKTPAHTMIKKQLETIEIGAEIKIVWVGSKPTQKGNDMQIYETTKQNVVK